MNRFDPEKSAGFLIARAAYHLKGQVRKFLAEADIQLSPEEIAILTAMAHLDSAKSMGELSERLARDSTTLTHQLKHLVEIGLVSREPSEADRRIVNISITTKGRALVESTMPLTLDLRKRTFEGISAADRKTLVRIMSRVLQNLREMK